MTNGEIAEKLDYMSALMKDRFINEMTWDKLFEKYSIYGKKQQIAIKEVIYNTKLFITL